MSFFGNLFGGNKKASSIFNAQKQQEGNIQIIGNLRDQIELLEKRNNFIEKKKNSLVNEAKQKLNGGDKKGALLILNQKKKVESEIEKNQGTQLLLENQLSALECATINKEVITSLMVGNKAIKQINQDLSPEKIDDLMDDIQEETENYKAIQDAMTQPLQQIYDDDELLQELDEICEEDKEDKVIQNLLNVDGADELKMLPDVPNTVLPVVAKKSNPNDDIELELKQLELSMCN
jgi:hypothetical protein